MRKNIFRGGKKVKMHEELNLTSTEEIQNLIYTIRGKNVMLDSDVAKLYDTETKKINQAVKRNIGRFPDDFCFQITEEELEQMRSQIVTVSKNIEKYIIRIFNQTIRQDIKQTLKLCTFLS